MRRGCLGVGFKAGITLWTSYVNARIFTGICIVILVYLIDACMVLKFSILLNIFFEKIYGPHTEEWKGTGSFTLQK